MLPDVAAKSPESRLISVDLPAPFGPSSACSSPRTSVRLTASLATRPPKRRVSARASRIASGMAVRAEQAAPHAPDEMAQSARKEQHQEHDCRTQPQLPVLGKRREQLLHQHEHEG